MQYIYWLNKNFVLYLLRNNFLPTKTKQMARIETALDRASDTKALMVGKSVIGRAAEMFATQFPGKRAVIVADTTTYGIAGDDVRMVFENAGISQQEPCVFDAQKIYASWEWVEKLDDVLRGTDAVAVAVGSGTINDLVKLSSSHVGRRYMTIATAASMDGYTAFGASITFEGAKQTFSCPAPLAVLADTALIASAPHVMTASGYADLFAKVPSGADWMVADALGVEPIDGFSFSLVKDNLMATLSNTEGVRSGDPRCMEELINGLLFSGFAMQAHKSSRPASGADHQFSHLWDMEHHTMPDGNAPSHGFKVAIGLLASIALYEELLATDIERLDVDACVAAWHTPQQMERTALDLFRDSDFPAIGLVEYKAKYIDRNTLREQLLLLRRCWPSLREALRDQLVGFETASRMLSEAGAPTMPEQINISRRRLRDSYRRALYIRRRFTVLDLADRCGMMDRWLDNIFAPGKVWEIL
jgi:glycerol-1-phosphate dehydrogenase [NAD(P)+]